MQRPYEGLRVIDAHVHFFSHQFFQSFLRSRGRQIPERDPQPLLQRLGWEIPPAESVELGRRWVEELDRHGLERAVLLGSIMDDEESVARAVQAFPDRLIGFMRVDPTKPDAVRQVRHAVEEMGLKGIKGFPAMECFHANDERVYPVYAEAQRLGLPVLFHFGLLQSAIGAALKLPSQADARFSNPMDLQRASRDFPGVNFIVPHFGAGYFGETLLLAAHCPNVFIDTSSANGWVRYMPYPMDLKLVFQRTLEAVGPERIIFGTDSSHFPRGFRREILEEQLGILNALGVSKADAQLILGGNIARLLRLDW
ncbi:MAG: amidohydrolase [Nitrospinae bacterium]|nr:amidohydrolase [Nitrospinota bacterium]